MNRTPKKPPKVQWEQVPIEKPEAVVKPLLDLQPATEKDGNTLLGNRFLCRGSGGLLIGPTGIGKSTTVNQMGICWSVGRPCSGIVPRQPLKILYIQSENDEGDLCEMRDGVLEHLKLKPKELKLLKRNFICVFESSRTRGEFVTETLEPLLKKHKPDLVILDPALAYIGGNASEQETVGSFLRNLLNPVLQTHKCGILLVHHTPKPNGDANQKKKVATDFAYAGLGSVEWANWARFILVLSTRHENGVRELRIAKRFRLGWKDALGNPCFTRLLRQNSEGGALYYTELTPEEALDMDGKLTPLQKFHRSGIFARPGEEIAKDALIARIADEGICGLGEAGKEVLPLLISDGLVEEFEKPRSGARPEKWLRRTDKKFNRTSFVTVPANPPAKLVTDQLQMATAAVCN